MEQPKELMLQQTGQKPRAIKILLIIFLLIVIFFAFPLLEWIPAPHFLLPSGVTPLISSYLNSMQRGECEGCQEVFRVGSVERTEECKHCQHFYSDKFVSHLSVNNLPPQIGDVWDFTAWSMQRVDFHILHPWKLWRVKILLRFDQDVTLPLQMTIERQKDGSWKIVDLYQR